MEFTHNPHTYLNMYISMMRNMFLTSSVALAILAFSYRFKKFKITIKIIGILIMVYSIIYGYISSKNLKNYIEYLEKKDEIDVNYIQIKDWKIWINMTYLYMILIVIIVIIILNRKILNYF